MTNVHHRAGAFGALTFVLTGCTGTPGVQYHLDPPAEAGGYRFVIPRTVVKVSAAQTAADHTASAPPRTGDTDHSSSRATDNTAGAQPTSRPKLSLTPVPVNYDRSGQQLPIYSVTDDTGGWKLVSTSITNVKYADYLIIQSIGTQVTDNRKDAIATIVGIVGAVATFAEASKCSESSPLSDFLIEDFKKSDGPVRAGDNNCWGYQITEVKEIDSKTKFPIPSAGSALPTGKKTGWFPYPACTTITITVFPCEASDEHTCVRRDLKSAHYDGTISVADGSAFRRIPLPLKGKVEMHADFCVADVTSDTSPLSSDWSLVSEAIKDVQALKQKKSGSGK